MQAALNIDHLAFRGRGGGVWGREEVQVFPRVGYAVTENRVGVQVSFGVGLGSHLELGWGAGHGARPPRLG